MLFVGFLIAAGLCFFAIKRRDADAARVERRLAEYEAQLKELAHVKENFHSEVEMARANALTEASDLRAKLAEESQHRQLLEEALLSRERAEQNRAMGMPSEPVALSVSPHPISRKEAEAVFEAMSAPMPEHFDEPVHVHPVDVTAKMAAHVEASPAPISSISAVSSISNEAHDALKAQIDHLTAEIAEMGRVLRTPPQDSAKETADAIVRAGDKLHDGARVFSSHIARLGNHLRLATEAYNEAVASMDKDLLSHAREIGAIGGTNGGEIILPGVVESRPSDIQRVEIIPSLNLERASGQ